MPPGGRQHWRGGNPRSKPAATTMASSRSARCDNAGWGYNVNLQDGSAGATGLGQVAYQNQYGLAQLTAQRFGGATARVFWCREAWPRSMDTCSPAARCRAATRSSRPPLSNVDVTSRIAIGKTDSERKSIGDQFVAGTRSTRSASNQASVPLDYEIDATDQTVSVPRLGGTIVRFGLHALHAVRACSGSAARLCIMEAPPSSCRTSDSDVDRTGRQLLFLGSAGRQVRPPRRTPQMDTCAVHECARKL